MTRWALGGREARLETLEKVESGEGYGRMKMGTMESVSDKGGRLRKNVGTGKKLRYKTTTELQWRHGNVPGRWGKEVSVKVEGAAGAG